MRRALALTLAGSLNGEDGMLTMKEVIEDVELNADLVALSACNTAAGAEGVGGLGRAFFFAGARALLVTHWPVETNSAAALTTATFRLQAQEPGLGRAEALRRAEIELMDGPGMRDGAGRQLYSWSHPVFWGAYALIGDGSR